MSVPRDENGLVTPEFCGDVSKSEFVRIQKSLGVNVFAVDVPTGLLAEFDMFSFWNFGGFRQTLVLMPNGVRHWLTTKTKWEPSLAEIVEATRRRWQSR